MVMRTMASDKMLRLDLESRWEQIRIIRLRLQESGRRGSAGGVGLAEGVTTKLRFARAAPLPH